MVKKKGKSKRTTLKDKYKIERRVKETHRKRKKQAKQAAAAGIVQLKKKDPGIPNSWPFKQELLQELQRAKKRDNEQKEQVKLARKENLQALREHQAQGGTARTIAEMLTRAQQDQATYAAANTDTDAVGNDNIDQFKSDGSVPAGQASRRAYLRELKKVVDAADVVLQVLDARDPVGSRMSKALENMVLSRPDQRLVLVLNKIDLVPKAVVSAWLTCLRRFHPTIAIQATGGGVGGGRTKGDHDDASLPATASNTPVGMEGLLQLLKNYARTSAAGGDSKKSKTAIVVGIVGFPNTGKSSLCNALKRSRAVGVSSKPGFTTTMQEVVLDKTVRLLDSPGVVFDDKAALLGNCVDAESIADPMSPVHELLQRCDHSSLLMTYSLPQFPQGNVDKFLALIAKTHGRVLKGGIPDKIAAARVVLKDWNSGKIPYYTTPPLDAGVDVDHDAVVVSQFGKEFDLAKYDDEVLNNLQDRDEMDFVALSAPAVETTSADMEIAEEAEDYDFDRM